MAFWSDVLAEPKRQYRWVMYINNLPQWIVKKVTKPSFTITESNHTYINHVFYYPGKVEYDPLSVTLVDAVEPNGDTTQKMLDILYSSGYVRPDRAESNTTTISKVGASMALGNVRIEQIGPVGSDPIEVIQLRNAWVKSVKLGDLDYESDDLLNIDLEIRYDYFDLETNAQNYSNFVGTLQDANIL